LQKAESMSQYADLEITFRKRDEYSYGLSFRYTSPDDEADHPSQSEPVIVLDFSALKGDNADAYSQSLSAAFFTPEIRVEFDRFRAITQQKASILRVRLTIDANAPELHAVHWETLRDPSLLPSQKDAHLFTGEQIIVSRFLNSGDWRPIRLRPKAELRALLVIANPRTSANYGLAPIDVAAELAQARHAMTGISVAILGSGGAVSLNELAAKLREGFDLVYLVCHGKLVDQEPYLYLAEGKPDQGLSLVQAIRELDQRPRMVVLASCQSAGKGEVGLAGLGPRLAEAGVPAIIAMQGNIFMTTAAAFMKRFFTELLVDGQIDRAMAIARGEVRNTADYWMPVLFLRLRNGRIWYEPGFGGDSQNQFDKWKSICSAVRTGHFIPVLGPELGEELFGGTAELASSLADKNGFPMGSRERTDLSKVTHFISVNQKRSYACQAMQDEVLAQVARRIGASDAGQMTLATLLEAAVDQCRSDPDNPYRAVSELPASIYLNANYNPLLLRSIKAEGKDPEPVYACWRGEEVPQKPQPRTAKPTPEAPWVYHVFGIFGKPDSMVLTEDDFFDYLIASSRLDLLLPTLVGQLMQSSLLFLGFRLDDWRFRVLFRMIVTRPGMRTMRQMSHVGVQVNPGEQNAADVKSVRKYIESYFKGADDAPEVSIYWGTPTDFLKQLKEQMASTAGQAIAPLAQGGGDDWF
jgi:hypothetical protein